MSSVVSWDWDAPQCLVENDDGRGLVVNAHTTARLRAVDVPVVVVGIVGIYRTGKSYLMNRLAQKQHGFHLGSSIQSKTKGIWIWCRPHPVVQNSCLLLLDTEGLGDVEKGDKNHDTWIFALSVLLCGMFTYNSIGVIDQDAIDGLHFVTELSDHIKIRANAGDGQEETEFDRFFPSFIWAVRDFTLDLEIDGKQVTADEYLEHALLLKKGLGRKVQEHNLPRECLRRFFPSRRCFCFTRPVNSKSELKNIEDLPLSKLDPEFLEECDAFCTHVFHNSRPKTVAGRAIDGRMFGGLVECYVTAIQNGAVPCIESAVETTAQLENGHAVTASINLYKVLMQERLQMPTDSLRDLSDLHHQCEKEAVALFITRCIFDKEELFQQKMMIELQTHYQNFCATNETESKKKKVPTATLR